MQSRELDVCRLRNRTLRRTLRHTLPYTTYVKIQYGLRHAWPSQAFGCHATSSVVLYSFVCGFVSAQCAMIKPSTSMIFFKKRIAFMTFYFMTIFKKKGRFSSNLGLLMIASSCCFLCFRPVFVGASIFLTIKQQSDQNGAFMAWRFEISVC